MIKINFNDDEKTIIASGHAEYGEHGKDIVCAAVSILFYTYANATDGDIEEHDGFTVVYPGEKKLNGAYETVKCGFESIMESFSDYVIIGN